MSFTMIKLYNSEKSSKTRAVSIIQKIVVIKLSSAHESKLSILVDTVVYISFIIYFYISVLGFVFFPLQKWPYEQFECG